MLVCAALRPAIPMLSASNNPISDAPVDEVADLHFADVHIALGGVGRHLVLFGASHHARHDADGGVDNAAAVFDQGRIHGEGSLELFHRVDEGVAAEAEAVGLT